MPSIPFSVLIVLLLFAVGLFVITPISLRKPAEAPVLRTTYLVFALIFASLFLALFIWKPYVADPGGPDSLFGKVVDFPSFETNPWLLALVILVGGCALGNLITLRKRYFWQGKEIWVRTALPLIAFLSIAGLRWWIEPSRLSPAEYDFILNSMVNIP